MCVLFLKQAIYRWCITIAQYLFSALKINCLRNSYLNIYSITFVIITCCLLFSLVSYLETLQWTSSLISNTFCEALDEGKEVRAVFCDISKAFDRGWHAGFLYKLEAAGVTGEDLAWFKNYLSDRKQRVVLLGVTSDWASIRAGVPQGSVLGPLLFLLHFCWKTIRDTFAVQKLLSLSQQKISVYLFRKW